MQCHATWLSSASDAASERICETKKQRAAEKHTLCF